ncbi:MAG: hypothetical protein Q8R02_19600 [Hyphomonadaceae bacterium]|nr:hypothetical protein [Hyphomonadaceae bacterium]
MKSDPQRVDAGKGNRLLVDGAPLGAWHREFPASAVGPEKTRCVDEFAPRIGQGVDLVADGERRDRLAER